MSLPTNPLNRKEAYLNAIATGNTVDMPAKPITREETYLDYIARHGGGSGGAENYSQLNGKPQINNVELASGNNSLSALGIASESAVNGIKDGQSINSFSAVETALGNKVDKVAGKGLSANDYSDTEKGKVTANAEAIEAINENGACNILPNNATSQEYRGITYTVNSDRSISISGTADLESHIDIATGFRLKTGRYTIYKAGDDSEMISPSNYNYSYLVQIGGSSYDITNEDVTVDINDSDNITFSLYVGVGKTVNKTVYPMLYDARLTPTGYVPYAMTNRELTERVDRGSVSVTGDGVKTYTDLLNGLFALIDTNKISYKSRLRLGNVYIPISQITNYFVFDGIVDFQVTGKIFAYSIYLNNNDSVFMETEISASQTLFTNHSPMAAPSGQVISLYY